MSVRAAALIGAGALLLAGCSETSYRVGDNMATWGGATATAGAGGSGGVNGGSSGSGGVSPSCEGPPSPGPAPLSRLTNPEIVSTLRALVGSSDVEGVLVGSEGPHYELSPEVEVSAETIERLHQIAHLRAESIAGQPSRLAELTGCDVVSRGEAACKTELYDRFVTRAFRRPLTDTDRAEMDAVYADGKALGGSYASGARAVIEVTLQSPELVYLVAEGDGSSEGELVPLTGHETASRVAYFLTGAPPDDALWQAAAVGRLDDGAIAEHARRLLGTPQNRQQLRSFFERRLGLHRLEPSDASGFSSTLAELTREAGFRFVEEVTFEGAGTFHTLMTSPVAFMNARLASFYGVPNVTGEALQRVSFDVAQRRGLLTQPALLRGSSPGELTRPVLRGVEVLKSVLCATLPAPPPSVPTLPEPSGPMTTMRERLTTATMGCGSACHGLINSVGLAFENYDAFGRYRTTEDGMPIDASGTLLTSDVAGPFQNALELIDRLAESTDAERCFQRHWLTEAYRRQLEDADACELTRLASAVDASGGKLTDVVVAAAQGANLKYRPKAK